MRYCERCHVSVQGGAICPLCKNTLRGESEPPAYPHISRRPSKMGILYRLLLLITIAGGAVCVALNQLLPESGGWSFYVVLGIICFWISFPLFCRHRRRVPRLIAEQSVVILILALFWDGITGWRGWSAAYVWPILFCAALIATFIYVKVKRLLPREYIVSFLLESVLAVVPFFFFMGGGLREGLPALLSGILGFASAVGLLLFDGQVLKQELSRRFHL